eukprot:GHRR01017402.1.p1 GENE.GHRR01017402.1~~GHRR01017402.1.p1  ORF type:complete len:402 (+),score=169.99 GHRR01017402.1:1271-2476(+)
MLVSSCYMPQLSRSCDLYRWAVGLYNRKTKMLRVMKAAGGTVVRVEAQALNVSDAEVAGVVKPRLSEDQRLRQQQPKDLATRRAEARRLVEAFGSTRRKRQAKQREEGAVQVDRNADEGRLQLLMQEVAAKAEAAGETRQEVMARVGAARVVPVHDPKATQAHQAYRVTAMFPVGLLASLNIGQLLHAAEKPEDREKLAKKVPAYVMSRLHCLSDAGGDQELRKRRARLLALLAALLQLATARPRLQLQPPRPAKEPGGRERPGGLEELAWQLRIGRKDVLEPLLTMFYSKSVDEGTVTYVHEKQQLLLMHLLVVALDLDNWTLAPAQFDALRKDLKMTAPDVASRFRELGCVCKASKLPGAPAASTAEAISSYTVSLLADGTKTLEECFPQQKTGPKQRR